MNDHEWQDIHCQRYVCRMVAQPRRTQRIRPMETGAKIINAGQNIAIFINSTLSRKRMIGQLDWTGLDPSKFSNGKASAIKQICEAVGAIVISKYADLAVRTECYSKSVADLQTARGKRYEESWLLIELSL